MAGKITEPHLELKRKLNLHRRMQYFTHECISDCITLEEKSHFYDGRSYEYWLKDITFQDGENKVKDINFELVSSFIYIKTVGDER